MVSVIDLCVCNDRFDPECGRRMESRDLAWSTCVSLFSVIIVVNKAKEQARNKVK